MTIRSGILYISTGLNNMGHNEHGNGHSEQKENYLRAVFHWHEVGSRASTTEIAKEVGVSPASVTDMLKKLAEEKLVDYASHQGATLTEKGLEIATRIERRHRIIEWFLYKELGMDWNTVDIEAHRLEHAFSDEAVDKLEKKCGFPKTCAHGNPVPHKNGKIPKDGTISMLELLANDKASVAKIHREDTEFLQYLTKIGLVPKAQFTVTEMAPFEGPLTIKIGKNTHAVGRQVAGEIWVKKT